MAGSDDGDLRIAIVGLGKMGLLHACLLNVLPRVKLVALCDKGGLIRKVAGRLFRDVRMTDDVGQLAGLGLDAVYVTTARALVRQAALVDPRYSKLRLA